ncbi:SRPBCC family protein [Kribbella sp. NPDC026596]|uniref:SRPBCC family protein n=1 Tax=Kribbella sp. NPDC026596 TaxID=3155122 RepID=UPI0033D43803
MADLTESIPVQAPAAAVYALVSNLPRMREWSPECTRVTWSSHTPVPSDRSSGRSDTGHGASGAAVRRDRTFGTSVQPERSPDASGTGHGASGAAVRRDRSYGRSVQPERSPDASGTGHAASRTPGPAVGARFVGHNRVGVVRWFTFGRVVDAEPGRRFAFTIHFGPIPISLWAYDFTPTATGCEVTESWTDHRPAALRLLFRPIFGNRTPRNLHGIHTTLTRLKTTAEATPSPTPPTDTAQE